MEFELSRVFLVRQFRVFSLGFPEPDLQHSYGGRVRQPSVPADPRVSQQVFQNKAIHKSDLHEYYTPGTVPGQAESP
jgi:hypothetical protein